MSNESFSRREGYGAEEREISVRQSAPCEVRGAIISIAARELGLAPKIIRDVLCEVLRKMPNQDNWSYDPVLRECKELIDGCDWWRVYDFVEALHDRLATSQVQEWPRLAQRWEELVNEYFLEAGVGWRMADGQLESRGPKPFETAVESARSALDSTNLPTARQEIDEALRDLSRRPEPDLTGAVHHAMVALECTAREAARNPRATLGEILKQHPDVVPRPLNCSIAKMWGYASEKARHVREGGTPSRAEAQLVVHVSAAACTYLATRLGGDDP